MKMVKGPTAKTMAGPSPKGSPLISALRGKPKLRITARYDEYGGDYPDEDPKFKKQELMRLKAKHKALKDAHDNMDEAKVVKDAKQSLKSEMLRNKARMMEMGGLGGDDDMDGV